MTGIEGLKLLNTEYVTRFTSSSGYLAILFAIIIMAMIMFGVLNLSEGEVTASIIMFIIGGISILLCFSPLIKYEGYKRYTFAIENENYHINLDRYEIIEKNGKEIIIKEKID